MIRLQPTIVNISLAASLGLGAISVSKRSQAETVGDRPTSDPSGQVDEWLATAAQLNRPTMTDPAGSHGSFGIDFGAGVSRLSTNAKNRITQSELGGEEASSGIASVNVPKFWISKGTMLPVDFTITGGSTRDRTFANLGGIIQVTLFEARSLPAISIRGFHGQTFGKSNTHIKSNGGEVAVSMGFLRYFQGYMTTGVTDHSAEFRPESNLEESIALLDANEGDVYTKEWKQLSRGAGLKVTVIPGRLSVTAETTSFKTNEDAFNLRFTAFL